MENVGNPGAWGSEEDQRLVREQKNTNVSAIQNRHTHPPPRHTQTHTHLQTKASVGMVLNQGDVICDACSKSEVLLGFFIDKHYRKKDQRQTDAQAFFYFFFVYPVCSL